MDGLLYLLSYSHIVYSNALCNLMNVVSQFDQYTNIPAKSSIVIGGVLITGLGFEYIICLGAFLCGVFQVYINN